MKVHVKVDCEKVYKARPVPYALKDGIKVEFVRLVHEDIYQPVNYSK